MAQVPNSLAVADDGVRYFLWNRRQLGAVCGDRGQYWLFDRGAWSPPTYIAAGTLLSLGEAREVAPDVAAEILTWLGAPPPTF